MAENPRQTDMANTARPDNNPPDTTMGGTGTTVPNTTVSGAGARMTVAEVKAIGVGQTCHKCNEGRTAGDCIMVNGRCSNCVFYGNPDTCKPSALSFEHTLYKQAVNFSPPALRQPKPRGQPNPAPAGCDQQPNGPVVLLPQELIDKPLDHLEAPTEVTERSRRNKRFAQKAHDRRIAQPSSYTHSMAPPSAGGGSTFGAGSSYASPTPSTSPYMGMSGPVSSMGQFGGYQPYGSYAASPSATPVSPSAYYAQQEAFHIQQQRIDIANRDLQLQRRQYSLNARPATPSRHPQSPAFANPQPPAFGQGTASDARLVKRARADFSDIDGEEPRWEQQQANQQPVTPALSQPPTDSGRQKRSHSEVELDYDPVDVANMRAKIAEKTRGQPTYDSTAVANMRHTIADKTEQRPTYDRAAVSNMRNTIAEKTKEQATNDLAVGSKLSTEKDDLSGDVTAMDVTADTGSANIGNQPLQETGTASDDSDEFLWRARNLVEENMGIFDDGYDARVAEVAAQLRAQASQTVTGSSEPVASTETVTAAANTAVESSEKEQDDGPTYVRETSLDPNLDYSLTEANSAAGMGGDGLDAYVSDDD